MTRMFCGKNHWSEECRRLATSTNNQNEERRCFICLSNKNLFEERMQQETQKGEGPSKILATDNNNTKEGIHRKSKTDDVVDVQPWCNAEVSDPREELKLDSNLEMKEEVGRHRRRGTH